MSALLAISVDFFFLIFFFSDDNLQSLNIHAGFNSALKSVGGRCLSGIKALCGLREAQPHGGAATAPGGAWLGVGSVLSWTPN